MLLSEEGEGFVVSAPRAYGLLRRALLVSDRGPPEPNYPLRVG